MLQLPIKVFQKPMDFLTFRGKGAYWGSGQIKLHTYISQKINKFIIFDSIECISLGD